MVIPTSSNQYRSKFDNLPNQQYSYDKYSVRQIPQVLVAPPAAAPVFGAGGGAVALDDQGRWRELFEKRPGLAANPGTGIGYNFDPIPIQGNVIGLIPNNAIADENYNYNLNPNAVAAGGAPIPLSRFMIHGGLNPNEPKAPSAHFPKDTKHFNYGPYRQSSTFTTSMIEPSWLFTEIENATMQTFDCQLLWGDTSEEVQATPGQPFQISLICSP